MRAAARVFCLLLLALRQHPAALAALTFPALTGHVVDDAGMLSPAMRASLEQTLTDYERGTGNQVVIATLRSLQGDSIDDYGVALGRKWGLGQKNKNNGTLLLVAPHEKKIRIDLGYGLGQLTDPASARSSTMSSPRTSAPGIWIKAWRTARRPS